MKNETTQHRTKTLLPAQATLLIAATGVALLVTGCETTGLSPRETEHGSLSHFVYQLAREQQPGAASTYMRKPIRLAVAQVGEVAPSTNILNRLKSNSTERIGIYDSRAVAVAYAGSSFQQAKMSDLVSQQKKAKAAGDRKEIARLEAEGRAWQAQLHKQGFSTAPVDDLLAHISSELPKIQTDAGATRIISKRNKPELKKHASAEKIDVTMKLVDAFHPNERQRNYAIEIQKKKPAKLKE